MRGEFVDVGGVRLYYYAAGTRGVGEPVVFLHGFPASGHLWSDVVPLVPVGHRVVVVDVLGYGGGGGGGGRPGGIRARAGGVGELVCAVGIDCASVYGLGI